MAEFVDDEDTHNFSRDDSQLCFNILSKIYGNSLKAAAEFELEVSASQLIFTRKSAINMSTNTKIKVLIVNLTNLLRKTVESILILRA